MIAAGALSKLRCRSLAEIFYRGAFAMLIYGMNSTARGRRNVCNERNAHKTDTLIKHVDKNVEKVIREEITHLNPISEY